MAQPDIPTQLLIQSNAADQMTVKSRDGEKIGYVFSFMINKRSGQALYAVLTIGGFLGIGKAYYPLPFQLLAYDPANDGYQVTIDRRLLEGGPSWANNPPLFDQSYADRVASYYGVASESLALDTTGTDAL
ncbi:photosystem reaction center subunit H [Sphingomonas sp. Root710]|uniref:PRC-barrel domain-containing protein n=1 Tax=Sphingomonas sp. Root710 TaxID=1736594 RepID=UPI0006F4BEF4|nr:PRC-barrel domain-containing protein [Sphingomonas sp. Root710]KRB79866.1 photosystem reaction center subunit H [Sphingomonas sp. Root710]